MFLYITLGIILIFMIIVYNRIVTKLNMIIEAKRSIDIYLKQRFDLIPNLVECVEGAKIHEEKVLREIIEVRAFFLNCSNTLKNLILDKKIDNSMIILNESYPILRANDNFLMLQKKIGELEERLQAARRFYNSSANSYNTLISKFPNSIISKMFNFKTYQYLEIPSEEKDYKFDI